MIIGRLNYIVALCLISANCFSAAHYKPGDKNYPKTNPSPAHYIEISVRIDPTLRVEFDAVFRANAESCMHQPAGSALEGAGEFAYDVTFPIPMKQTGDHSTGRLATDAVLPGNCDWRFSAVLARAHNEDPFHGKLVIQGQWVAEMGSANGASKDPNPSVRAICQLTDSTIGTVGVELQCFNGLPWLWISPVTNALQIEILSKPSVPK